MPVTRAAAHHKTTSYSGAWTIANVAVDTAFGQSHSLPANAIRPGMTYRLTARGVYSSLASGQGNLELKVRVGVTAVASTTSFLMAAGVTNRMWELTVILIPGGIGVVAPQESLGRAAFNTTNQVTASSIELRWPYGANPTINTTVGNILGLSVQFTVASSSNTITLQQVVVEELG